MDRPIASPHEIRNPETLPPAQGFSHAVIAQAGRTVYLAGQTAQQTDGAVVGSTTFNWNVNGGAWTNNVNEIQVASNGSNLYDNSLLTLQIVLPTNYTAPQPATETLGAGWFKIKYRLTGTAGGNDTATWSVNIRGNPVHLVTP